MSSSFINAFGSTCECFVRTMVNSSDNETSFSSVQCHEKKVENGSSARQSTTRFQNPKTYKRKGGYKAALQMLETEKANLLSLVPQNTFHLDQNESGRIKTQSPLERMQQFLQCIHENCYHILGSIGPSLGKDFYQIPQLASALISSIFSNLEYVPDYRIRTVIRTFFKSFISSCPKVYYKEVLLPVLSVFLPYMLTRLTKKWEHLFQLRNESNTEEEGSDAQEVLDEKLNSFITREYSDVIKICLVGGNSDSSLEKEVMEQDDVKESSTSHRNVNQVFTEAVSELGLLLIRNESTQHVIILTLLRFLTWSDSNASLRAAGLLHSVVRQLSNDDALNDEIVTHVITTVLQALQIHGQHEPIQGLLLTLGAQLYELLRPKFPSILNILVQIPNVNQQDLQRFDEKILNSSQGCKINYKVDKTTKDLFKKITHPLIGRSMGQLFKKEVQIMNLPKLKLPKRQTNENFDFDYASEINQLLS